jgi:hypothetical protein
VNCLHGGQANLQSIISPEYESSFGWVVCRELGQQRSLPMASRRNQMSALGRLPPVVI